MIHFPIFIEIKNCLFIGGGNVVSRKVKTILNFCDNIKIVAPKIQEKLEELCKENEDKIKIIKREFLESDLENVNLVFVATDNPEIDKTIAKLCKEKKIMANIATFPKLCDFYFPAIVKKDDLVIGISTNGKSPAIAKKIKELILKILPKDIGENLKKIGEIRKESLENKIKLNQNIEYNKFLKTINIY